MVDYLGSGGYTAAVPNSTVAESSDTAGNSASTYEYKVAEMPTTATASKPAGGRSGKASANGENLWNAILQDVVKRDDQHDSHLLLLGNIGAGKRSIIREINNKYVQSRNKNMDFEKLGSDYAALDFSFLYVKDLLDPDMATSVVTSDDNLPKLNIWSVSDKERCDLIEAVLKPENLERTVAVICLDFDYPLEIMNNLRTWLSKLSKSLFALFPKMAVGAHEKMK